MGSLILLVFLGTALGLLPLGIAAAIDKGRDGGGPLQAIAAIVATVLLLAMAFYVSPPSLYEPFYGELGFAIWILWLIFAALSRRIAGVSWGIPGAAFALLTLFWLGSQLYRGSEMLNADAYAKLLGEVKVRDWTKDIQPKHPDHIRCGTTQSALALAKLALSQAGSIGSQFEINAYHATLQKVGDRFVYVIPLDHVSWGTFRHTGRVPGFIKVSGEDPYQPAELVTLPPAEQLVYTPGAYFGQELYRYLWSNGYASAGLGEYLPELDEQGKLWWIVTTFEYAVGGWGGERVTGVLQVDPVSGAITPHKLDVLPAWIDRVFPEGIVRRNIAWRGLYASGYMNTVRALGLGARKDLVEPDHTNLVFGGDGQLNWVTGVTSTNSRDAALLGYYYTDSRTGRSVFYRAQGATETSILSAIDKHQDVVFRKLHGVTPQIYNISGTMAALVPMLNDNAIFQGMGIVNVGNIQLMAFGSSPQEAYEKYLTAVSSAGARIAVERRSDATELEGVVDRFFAEAQGSATTFYLHLKDVPHLFFGTSQLSAKLRMTQVGDRVRLRYVSMGSEVEPLKGFDNLALPLAATK